MAKIITGHRVGQNGIIRVGCSAAIFDSNREKNFTNETRR